MVNVYKIYTSMLIKVSNAKVNPRSGHSCRIQHRKQVGVDATMIRSPYKRFLIARAQRKWVQSI